MLRAALKTCSLHVGMQEGGCFERTCRWAIGVWNKDMVNDVIGRAHETTDDAYAKRPSQGPHLSHVLE